MLREGLPAHLREHVLGLGEELIPARIRFELFENPAGVSLLFAFGKLFQCAKSLLQELGHLFALQTHYTRRRPACAGTDEDARYLTAELPIAPPEIVRHRGEDYIA